MSRRLTIIIPRTREQTIQIIIKLHLSRMHICVLSRRRSLLLLGRTSRSSRQRLFPIGLERLETYDGEVFDQPFLDLLEAVVVGVELGTGVGEEGRVS